MPKGTRKSRKLRGGVLIRDNNIRSLVETFLWDKKQLTEETKRLPKELRNVPIGSWDVSQVSDMNNLFYELPDFNEDISQWDVSNVTNMRRMFYGAESFNQPIGSWNVSKVENMLGMFENARSFNQPIGQWNVSNVKDMSQMFEGASSFNQPIDSWNVSKVMDMSYMFARATVFNQPIGSWNVSRVESMNEMFARAEAFNQPIGSWDVSRVESMNEMFARAEAFNQPIGSWDVSNVTGMESMFEDASSFNQPINSWSVSEEDMEEMFAGSAMSPSNYPGAAVEEPPEVRLKGLGYSEQAIKFILDDKTYDDDFVDYVQKIQDKTGTDYIDVVSRTLMIDPVIASDNHVYERATLKRLLTLNPANRKSSFTRETLTGNPNELTPAVELRSQVNELINKYILEHPEQSAGRRRMTRKRKNVRRARKSKKVRPKRKW